MLPMPLTSDWSSSARLIPVRRARILAVSAVRSKSGSSGSGAMCEIADEQLAAHPEMGEDRVFAHRQPEVFPAPARSGDDAPPDGRGEIIGSGQVAADD